MKLKKLTPNLAVASVEETVAFYSKSLGFALLMAVPESQDRIDNEMLPSSRYVYALLARDEVEIMFQRSDSFRADVPHSDFAHIGASASFYMEVEGLEQLHASIASGSARVSDIRKTWYGMREFYVQDPNGYVLGFASE